MPLADLDEVQFSESKVWHKFYILPDSDILNLY